MIRVSVWMIRTALIYLGVGFTFGALLLANKGMPFEPILWRLLPVHVEMLLIGWTVQLALGVAAWIAPRFSTDPRYGNLDLVWFTFVSLNFGVLCAAGGAWIMSSALIFTGRMFQLIAVMAFAAHLWIRIKPISLPTTN